jgi:hypothetical protein
MSTHHATVRVMRDVPMVECKPFVLRFLGYKQSLKRIHCHVMHKHANLALSHAPHALDIASLNHKATGGAWPEASYNSALHFCTTSSLCRHIESPISPQETCRDVHQICPLLASFAPHKYPIFCRRQTLHPRLSSSSTEVGTVKRVSYLCEAVD